MELRQLRYFAEVAHVGSFLGAAERLDVAQPSLWRQVKALEAELAVPLFERSGRGVVITSAGSQLLPRAEQLLAQAEAIRVLSGELAHGRAGVVSIGCAHPHVPRFLAPLIGRFHRTHPGVHVAVHESPGLPPVEQVLTGDVDFVTALPRSDEALAGHRLGEVQLIVVTAEDHPWRHRAEIPASELAGVPVLIGGPGSLTRRLLEPALREEGVVLNTALETGNAPTLVAMARAGLGVAVLADDNLALDPAGTWPVLVDERYPMTTPIWLYWARHRPLAPPVRAFARHVRHTHPPEA
ncbi:LysR family transcriptional regulator [Geodermatophilus ruber]|uniref:DNA-binding transcriptional regulator, LysR family n=1 Tax=Geodermatophilus ruber TaxID=504800 RepID=A0A1I4GMF8_9ACTN|nr:LysR family transcriptional regulator [Geodermatophilus ruber]SFL31155.1 DNA-binding transcriptional regulator, LysR family [Geodermatophilus ruber]